MIIMTSVAVMMMDRMRNICSPLRKVFTTIMALMMRMTMMGMMKVAMIMRMLMAMTMKMSKIPSEMEVALLYTPFTLFSLLTLSSLFLLFKLLYTA